MNRADDKVESVEDLRSVVESTVGKDVGFDAFEHRGPGASGRVQLVDFLDLGVDFRLGEAAGVKGGLVMSRDADVLPAARRRSARHAGDRRRAVRIYRVAVQDSANVAIGDERREPTMRRGVDFTEPFAHRRVHVVETSFRVDGLFVGRRHWGAPPLEFPGTRGKGSFGGAGWEWWHAP